MLKCIRTTIAVVAATVLFAKKETAAQEFPSRAVCLISGDLGWTLSSTATAAPFIAGGTLRILAVADTVRSRYSPEIPTIAESGGPELTWLALVPHARTPAVVIQRINPAFRTGLSDPVIQERLPVFGYAPEPSSPKELPQPIAGELNKNRELLKRIGLSPPERP